jgi:hypothetical protein
MRVRIDSLPLLLVSTTVTWQVVSANETVVEEPSVAPVFTWRPTLTWSPTVTWSPTITPYPFFGEISFPTFESEVHHFDCFNCIENGFSFCPLDAVCWPNATTPFDWDIPVFPFSCQAPDDMLVDDSQLCSPSENFFSDPLYRTNEWVFDMINVRPVWEKGYFGASVRIRVNDGGFQVDHLEVRTDQKNGDKRNWKATRVLYPRIWMR